jgi:hypothetical protein
MQPWPPFHSFRRIGLQILELFSDFGDVLTTLEFMLLLRGQRLPELGAPIDGQAPENVVDKLAPWAPKVNPLSVHTAVSGRMKLGVCGWITMSALPYPERTQ